MKITILILILILIYSSTFSKEVVNDTLWTKRIGITPSGLFDGLGIALVPGENAFYIPRYDPNENDENLKYSIGKFSLESGEEIQHIPTPHYYYSLTLSADSSMYVGGDSIIYFLDAQTLNVIREVKVPPTLDENGDTIILEGSFFTRKTHFQKFIQLDATDYWFKINFIKIYNYQTDSFVKEFGNGLKTSFSPDENFFVTASSDYGSVKIYNTADWSIYDEFEMEVDEKATKRECQTLSFSPDGSEICFVINTSEHKKTQELKFYNVVSKQITKTIKVHDLFGEEKHYFERISYMNDDYIMFSNGKFDSKNNFIFSNLENNVINFPNVLTICYNLIRTNISTYYLYASTLVQKFDFRPELLTSVEENSAQTLYPNPTTGNLTYQFSSSVPGMLNWQLVDINGNEIINKSEYFNLGDNTLNLNISHLTNGIYFLNVGSNSVKIILEK